MANQVDTKTVRMVSDGGFYWLWAMAAFVVALAFIIASRLVEQPEITVQNAAAILALVSTAAVGIERTLEGFWTIIGRTQGTWWPLKPIGDRLNAFATKINDPNGPLENFLKKGEVWVNRTQEGVGTGKQYLDELSKHRDELQQLVPGNPQAQRIVAQASRAVVSLNQIYSQHSSELATAASAANTVLADSTN